MDVKSFAQSIARFAPLIGRALPLPGGEVIGDLIAAEFGGSAQNFDDLNSRIAVDGDAALKLKQFEMTHKENLQNICLQQQISDNTDKQSARAREIQLAQLGNADWVLPTLSMLITGAFFLSILVIMIAKTDSSDHDILYMMLGGLGTAFSQVVSYYLGSSHKESKIADMANNLYQSHQTLVSAVVNKQPEYIQAK